MTKNYNDFIDNQDNISEEELNEMINEIDSENNNRDILLFKEPIEFEEHEMKEVIESKHFKSGRDLALKLVGMYSTLVNFGVDLNQAIQIVLNQQTIEHNLESQRISSESNIEVSKNQLILNEKQQL